MSTQTQTDLPAPSPQAAPPRTGSRAASPSNAFLQLLRRLHFYVGIFVGPFLFIAALTGVAYAIAPAVETQLHKHELTAASPAQTVPLDEQVKTAQKKHPGLGISGVVPGEGGASTRVLFTDPGQPSASWRPTVFVDPSTGDVLGDTVLYGSSQAFPERAWLSVLHKRLHLGEPGRVYSELAAAWLGPVTIAGLILWWKRRKSGADKARSPWAKTTRSHSTVGVVMALGFLFLSATGLTWSAYTGANVKELRTALSWTTPKVDASLTPGAAAGDGGEHAEHGGSGSSGSGAAGSGSAHSGHAGHTGHSGHEGHAGHGPASTAVVGTFAKAADVARSVGLEGPFEIAPPSEGKGWAVKETSRSWTVGADAVAIIPATGNVIDSVPFRSFPIMAKLTDWGIRLHMGFLFGLPNQIILAAISGALALAVALGYRMWWMRRPTRGASFLGGGRAPIRGSLLRLFRARPVTTTAVALLCAAWAVFVPLLGISLVLFLAVDAALGWRQRRRDVAALNG